MDSLHLYTKKINEHVPSGWGMCNKFANEVVPYLLMVYCDKDCIVDNLEEEVKSLCDTSQQQPIIEVTDVLEKEYNEATECQICIKPFDDPATTAR